MIQIITDSSSGISQEEAKEMGITVLPINIDFDNEIFYDGVNITAEEFYAKIAESGALPATLPPNALEFLDRFESAKLHEEPLLVISVSSALSIIYHSATLCQQEVDFDQIAVIDSLTVGAGLRLVVQEAILHREDMNLTELCDHLNKFKLHIHTYFSVDKLDTLLASGRLTDSGNLPKCVLNIKPILALNSGSLAFVDKKIGTKNAQDFILERIKNTALASDYPVFIEYVRDPAKADYAQGVLASLFSTKAILASPLPYLLGAFLSENSLVFTFVSK